ncbi:hypothetical Protein YC6258_04194 [Gynuella sunshinyii YC6258]|uniref:Uncharacterized protein n=1 Tax=Gynuella sunshinyii YC6258 TaxID=1445510 RepID=A0A0C5VSD4_9GAMM|nr:hypothetical Protein YC6258_04194 [Gynuella sunshinyii YC6258]
MKLDGRQGDKRIHGESEMEVFLIFSSGFRTLVLCRDLKCIVHPGLVG